MSINKKDITIIIQGPLKATSLNNLEHYSEFGKVIVSHWSEDPIELQKQLIEAQVKYDNISSISSSDPPDPFMHPGLAGTKKQEDYRHHQFQSLHEALKLCKTKFALKTRSDEYWVNVDPLLKMFSKDINKLVTSNVFYKPNYVQPYHISDHLMLARTDLFLSAMNIIASQTRNRLHVVVTECSFGYAFLSAKYQSGSNNLPLPSNEEAFKNDFSYVNINEFDEYLVRWNSPPLGRHTAVWQKPGGKLYMGEDGIV